MRIAVVNTITGRLGEKGFYQSQETGLGRALAEAGHEVFVYKCLPRSSKEEAVQINDRLTAWYLPVSSIGIHGYFNTKLLPKYLDAVVLFADNQIFLKHIRKYCLKHGIAFIPYVGIMHSVKIGKKQSLKNKIHQFVLDSIFKAVTLPIYREVRVLAKTKKAAAELRYSGAYNVSVVPVGADQSALKTDFRRYDRNELRKKYGLSPDDKVISYIQRLIPEKNPERMLDIFHEIRKQSDEYRLIIVGDGICYDDIHSRAEKLGLLPYITFIKKIPHDEIWEIHYLSDYYVTLNPREIFGMALMEAVYYESTAFAIDSAGSSTILEDMEGEYICGSYESIPKMVLSCVQDEKTLRRNSNTITRKFTWRHCADKIAEIVRERRHQ